MYRRTQGTAVHTANLRGVAQAVPDGEKLAPPTKELGTLETFPQALSHNANGRFVAVSGDNEFVIYTAQALRNKSFGAGTDFVWSASGSGDFAVRQNQRVTVYKNFESVHTFRCPFNVSGMHGGALLGVRSSGFIVFYDWDSYAMVRRIDLETKSVFWSDAGDLVAITDESGFYMLRFDRDAVAAAALATGDEAATIEAEGVEAAFELIHEGEDVVRTATWVGDCLVYINKVGRLNYFVGGQTITQVHLEASMTLLGFLPREDRVYLMDKTGSVVAHTLYLSVLEYQTAVVRKDFDRANELLRAVPKEQYNDIAKFLQSQGFKEEALMVTRDPDHKFELALQLNKLDVRTTPMHIPAPCITAELACPRPTHVQFVMAL